MCWSLIANFHQNFGCQILLSLAMATKMVTGWSTGECGRFAIEPVKLLDDLKDATNASFVLNVWKGHLHISLSKLYFRLINSRIFRSSKLSFKLQQLFRRSELLSETFKQIITQSKLSFEHSHESKQ